MSLGQRNKQLPGGVEQTYELEKGHVFVLGQAHGVFLNDVADGFIDKTELICPRVLDIVGGVPVAQHGYCIVTDKDGDKAFLVWEGKGTADLEPEGAPSSGPVAPGSTPGLQGNNTFRYTSIGKTAAFVVVWEGDWRLP